MVDSFRGLLARTQACKVGPEDIQTHLETWRCSSVAKMCQDMVILAQEEIDSKCVRSRATAVIHTSKVGMVVEVR